MTSEPLLPHWLSRYPHNERIELADIFIQSMVADMHTLQKNESMIKKRKALHSMKGALATVGLNELSHLCDTVDSASSTQYETTIENISLEIDSEIEKSQPGEPLVMSNNKILILDDHPIHLKLLENSLRKLGVTGIYTHSNVDVAMETMLSQSIELVICDLSMPGKDGIDMLVELHQMGYNGNVAIVSAMDVPVLSTVKSMCASFSFEIIGQISKPFKEGELKSILCHQKKTIVTSTDSACHHQ